MPAAKFCVNGDYRPAVAAARSRDHCRECYNTEVLGAATDLLQFEVTADNARVTDVRTQVSHGKGSVVTLDPTETNVAALVAAGIGKVRLPDTKPAKPGRAAESPAGT